MTRYAIGLGSNMGDRREHLRSAVLRLGELGEVKAVSGLYETEPLGGEPQGPYLNAVVVLESELDHLSLLETLHLIESQQGRERVAHWGPRTLDLDILVSDGVPISGEELEVPHPRAAQREFVLRPLTDVWPDAEVAPGLSARQALSRVEGQGVSMVSEKWSA